MIWDIRKKNNIYDFLLSKERRSYDYSAYVEDGQYQVIFLESLFYKDSIRYRGTNEVKAYISGGVIVKNGKFIMPNTLDAIEKIVRESGYHGDFVEKIKLTKLRHWENSFKGVFQVSIGS